MSLPSSPTKDRGQLPQVLRPLLPAPSTGEDQPIAPTSSLLQGAEQLPLVEQPSLTEQPRRTEPQSVLSIPSALSQEEQSQISFDFDPLPAGIDLNFDRPYRPYSNTTPSTPAPTPAPIPEPQPVDPALSSTEFQLTSQSRSLTADHYFFKEPCPFTGIIRGAPTPAPAVTEAQTSSTPLSIDNTPDQPENPLQPPAPFSYGYTYPPPPVPGAPLLPFPPQDRKRKDAGSTGSKHSRKKRRTSEYPPPFKAPDTPRPRTPALPFGVPQSRSEGFLLPPTFDNRKRLASELEDYTVTCPAGKKICLEQPNEQPYEQQYEHPYNKPTQDPLAPVDIPEFVLLESLKRAGQHNSFILSLVVGNYREAKNRSELNSCDYQNTPVYQQPTEQQAPVDQTSANQASFEQASVEQASKKKDSNKKAAKKGSAETMSSNETPVEAPAQSFAMPAMNPAGYQVQDPSYEGRPYINMNPALDALGEFTDPDVYRKLKFGGMIIERANLAPSKSLPYPEQYKRLKNIQEELARQDSIAPILPPSELSPQDPKGFTPKPYNVPEDIEDRRVHDFFAQKNKDLCTRNKQVDLDRNNMAAKGTRQRREESLSQYRTIARDLAIERNWWRLKAASLGGDPTEFDAFTDHTRRAMSFEMDERMEKLEKEAAKKAKRVKAKAQAAITSQNNKLAKQDVQRQNKEIKQVVSAFAAGDLAAIERMSQADYDAKATAYRKPRTKQPSKRARKANNVDDDKDSNAEIETSEVETPANNATEEAAGDPGNSENIDSNMYGLDDLARANTELTTSDTNVASQSVYPSIEDAQPSNDFTFNPVPNFDSNVQAQDNEPSGAEELDDTEHNDLRRMPSNVTMFDAPTDGTHITTSMAPPGLMPTMMDQSAWAPPPTFDSSTLPPTQFNPQLNGPMGDMIMPSGDMHAPVNDMSMVPVNNMDFNFHNPMNDIGPMAPSYMTSDFQGTMNGIDAPSSQNLRQPWFRPTSNAESNALGPALPVMSQSIELPQQTATTNNTGTSDTFDRNADPSTFPDPHDEIFFGNYLGDMNSSQN